MNQGMHSVTERVYSFDCRDGAFALSENTPLEVDDEPLARFFQYRR
jgi:hypothetical protein